MGLLKGNNVTKPDQLQTVGHRLHIGPQLVGQDVNRHKKTLTGARLPLKTPWRLQFGAIQCHAVPGQDWGSCLPILKWFQGRRCRLKRLSLFRGKL